MKDIFILLLAIIGLQNAYSQNIIPSNCNAPDSVRALYEDDADRLAVRWVFDNNHAYKDSIRISDSVSNIFMKALLSVYNAKNLPARDTVIRKLNIQSFHYPVLKEVIVSADSNAAWMKSLRNNKIPTGNKYLDSIISTFNLQLESYYAWSNFNHWLVFSSTQNCNVAALCQALNKTDSVRYAEPNAMAGDGDEISAKVFNSFTELIYSSGWGDCPAGCIYRRFWKFRVYNDCSVEFVESYGDKMENTGLHETGFPNISLFPNPFQNAITINGLQAPFQYSISNIVGQILAAGYTEQNTINGLEKLERGVYILQIRANGKTGNFKLLKN